MHMKNEKNRSISKIGKRRYDFDFELELMIYRYLCCHRIKKRVLKKMDNKYKFGSYKQWKQYIHSKYEKYSLDELGEFSRYLNLKIREIKPLQQYWILMIPIVVTLAFSQLIQFFIKMYVEYSYDFFAQIILFLSTIFLGFIILIMIKPFLQSIFVEDFKINFLKDYKEIIDEMISNHF